ncbi:MAG: prepilin-type N-terminal cleavage/methylation domain-containing protein [Planctomycetes bacterium]|nr:prepilin-type N-terminal cleavage/methylation domain-containing protein [Planctomycetota bacterium]
MPVRAQNRRGFTLVEILVSILIFTIVSLALITILLTCTNLFRAGEYSRASTDEVIAVLGTLDNDLKHVVPPRDGGFFATRLTDAIGGGTWTTGSPRGNCAVAFKIENPDRAQIDRIGKFARLIVVYWVGGPGKTDEFLYRATEVAADSDGNDATTSELDVAKTIFDSPANPQVIARRCLHFGVWISTLENKRLLAKDSDDGIDWSLGRAGPTALQKDIQPTTSIGGLLYATEIDAGDNHPAAEAFPEAVRFTLTLANGRYVPKGSVIEDDTAGRRLRIGGLGAVPTMPGAMVRVDDEWIAYTAFQNGALITLPNRSSAPTRRSTYTTHQRNAPVWLGQSYSVVRILPK